MNSMEKNTDDLYENEKKNCAKTKVLLPAANRILMVGRIGAMCLFISNM